MKHYLGLGLFIGCLSLFFIKPIHADIPKQRVEIKVSSQTSTADVHVQTQQPGDVQPAPIKKHWWITALRWVQQILGGTIFLPS